jgi:hypothetical protein
MKLGASLLVLAASALTAQAWGPVGTFFKWSAFFVCFACWSICRGTHHAARFLPMTFLHCPARARVAISIFFSSSLNSHECITCMNDLGVVFVFSISWRFFLRSSATLLFSADSHPPPTCPSLHRL